MFMIKDSLREDREGLALLIGDVSLQRYMMRLSMKSVEAYYTSDHSLI